MAKEVETKRVGTRRTKRKKEETAFKKLKELECFPEIDAKIKAGVAIEEITRWLQEDMFEMTDIQYESLKRQLYRYKSSLPPAELLQAKEPDLYVRKAIEKMKRGVQEVDELEKLYLLQLQRISRDAQTEEKINKLFDSTSREIQLAITLLNKMVEVKAKLGLIDTTPDKVHVTGNVHDYQHVNLAFDDSKGDQEKEDKLRTNLGLIAQKIVQAADRSDDDPEAKH